MNVTDSRRATSAAWLVIAGLGANLFLTVTSMLIGWLIPGSYEGSWPLIQDLLWLGAVGVLAVGLFQLAGAVDTKALLQVSAAALIINGLLDTAVGQLVPKLSGPLSDFAPFIWDADVVLYLGVRLLLVWTLASLTMQKSAWVIPLLGTVAVLSIGRTALTLLMTHRLAGPELYASVWYRVGTAGVSLFNAVAMLVGAFAVQAAVVGGPNTPALVAAAGLQPAPAAATPPIADFLIGGILLAVGIGVTVVSLAAASNGGRYVVATGAIAVGVGRIIRGFMKLGRAA